MAEPLSIATFVFDIVKALASPFIKLIGWFYSKLPFEFRRRKQKPRLGILESSWDKHRWHHAKQGEKTIIVIETHWEVTNTLPYNITTLNAFLLKPQQSKGSWMVKDTKSQYHGHYAIPKGYTTDLNITFVIDEKHAKNAQSNIAVDLEIIDPLMNRHVLRRVIIEPITSPESPKAIEIPIENTSTISSGNEKKLFPFLRTKSNSIRLVAEEKESLAL